MSIPVICQCGSQFAAGPHLAGQQVACPACGRAIAIPAANPAISPQGTSQTLVTCHCGGQFNAPSHLFGQTVSCPTCSSPLIVGGTGGNVSHDPLAVAANFQSAGTSLPPMSGHSRPARKSKSTNVLLLVVAGIAGVTLLMCGGLSLLIWNRFSSVADSQPLDTVDVDYAVARQSFRTNLTEHGGAPQEWEPLRTPPGATEITYKSGNLSLKAYVDPPPAGPSRRPGLLFLHGGFAYGDGDWQMPDTFRRRGFVVMTPTLRGENGQPGDFTLYYDEVDDVLAAADALADLPYVDENQIFVAGHSAGGTLAALAAMASDRFKAAAAFSGCMDQRLNEDIAPFNTSSSMEFQIRSPLSYAGSFKCPVRLYYGNQETWAFDSTRRTATEARRKGLDVTATLVPGDHFTSVEPAIQRSLTFFRSHMRSSGPQLTPTPFAANSATRGTPAPTPFPTPAVPLPVPTPAVPALPPSTPQPPTIPLNPPGIPTIMKGRPVVIFEVQSAPPGNAVSAARRSLIRIRWVSIALIYFDQNENRLIVGVRGSSLNTGEAKAALQSAGFQIGSTTYSPRGL